MEALGIALGVLPLIVSVIEHYDFFAPFICHCAFTRELQNFRRTLDARKLLFRNECRLLLEALVEEELIEDMFRNGSRHPSWKEKELNERLRTYLGEAYGPCIGMITAIEDCLDQMRQKTQGLGKVLQPKTEVRPRSSMWAIDLTNKVGRVYRRQAMAPTCKQLFEVGV